MKILIIMALSLHSLISQAQRYSTSSSILLRNSDSVLYGYNGVWNFSGRSLSNPEVLDTLKDLDLLNLFRYPGGTIANSFNWQTGLPDDGLGQPCFLSDVKALRDSVHCDVLFVLNMLTKTLANQLQMLAAANALGIPIKYVELGNEFNNLNNPGHDTFPTPQSYADEAAIWMAAIKAVYPSCKVAFIGENKRWHGGQNWNSVMLTKSPDALTWHESPNLDQFYIGGVVDLDLLNTQINKDYATSGMSLVTSVPIWVTESNYTYDDQNIMSDQNQILTTFFITQQVSGLIRQNNHTALKIFIIRGIESSKQGAFTVTNSLITRQATAYAMALWNDVLIQQSQ